MGTGQNGDRNKDDFLSPDDLRVRQGEPESMSSAVTIGSLVSPPNYFQDGNVRSKQGNRFNRNKWN